MAEKLGNQYEDIQSSEIGGEQLAKKAEKPTGAETKQTAPEKKPDIGEIKKEIDKEARKSEEVLADNASEQTPAGNDLLVTHELRKESYKRTLKQTQKKLPAPDKALSKIVHQPIVNAVSKVGEKTIARPKGILTGSIIALIGSTYIFVSAKRYGYKYNFTVVIILFLGGYLLGLAIELLAYFAKKMKVS